MEVNCSHNLLSGRKIVSKLDILDFLLLHIFEECLIPLLSFIKQCEQTLIVLLALEVLPAFLLIAFASKPFFLAIWHIRHLQNLEERQSNLNFALCSNDIQNNTTVKQIPAGDAGSL